MANNESSAGRIIKHSTIYAVGNISRQLVGFLMLPLYTHYLTPADYGVVGLLTFALALLEPLFGARLGDATLKFYYEESNEVVRKRIFATSFIVTGSVSLLVATITCLSRQPASELIFGTAQYSAAVGMFAFVFLTQAVEYIGLTYIRIQQRPLLFISINLLKLVIQLALNIYLVVYLKLGVNGVVVSGVVSSALFATGLAIYTLWFTGIQCDGRIAWRMAIFSWPLWLSSLASLYIFSANRYYIRVFGTMAQVGYYELAAKFSMILGLVVWQPFSQFWETERFRHYKKTEGPVIFGSVFEFTSMAMFVGALGISIFSQPVIRLMSAPAFHEAANLVPWLCFAMLFGFLTMFANFSFMVSEKTVMIGRNNYITVAIITALNFALIPKFGYIGAGVSQLLALFMQFLITRHTASSHYDMNVRLGPVLAMLGVSAAGYLVANHLFKIESIWLDGLWKTFVFLLFSAMLLGVLLRSVVNRRQFLRILEVVVFPTLRKLQLMAPAR